MSDALSDFWEGFKHFWKHLFEVWWLALIFILTIFVVLFVCYCVYRKLKVYRSDIRIVTEKTSKNDIRFNKGKNID